MYRLSLLCLLAPLVAFAQLSPGSVTVTATRSVASKPDVARFTVTVQSGSDATLEDVVAAASGSGVKAENFTGVSYYQSTATLPVEWTFSLTAPVANLKATLGLLAAVQNSLAKEKKFALSFSVNGSESSPQSSSCALADLMADARGQAAKLATAAGVTVGPIQAISGATNVTGTVPSGIGGLSTVSAPVCSAMVRFALGGGF